MQLLDEHKVVFIATITGVTILMTNLLGLYTPQYSPT